MIFLMSVLISFIGCSEYDLHQYKDPNIDNGDSPGAEIENDEIDTESESESDIEADNQLDGLPIATSVMYLQTASTLYRWSEEYGPELIGDFFIADSDDTPNQTDIAIDMEGRMWGVSTDSLYRINPETAELQHVFDLQHRLYGLTFLADGRLLGAGDGIFWIDLNSGAMATFVHAGLYQTSGDIVGLPDGKLYWTVQGGDDLVVVDPITAETEWVGYIGMSNLWGVGYYAGKLYGVSSSGSISEIDPQTGAPSNVRHGSEAWWGAATNPVLWD